MNKIYFKVTGNGKPLILLHGFPLDHSIWKTIVGPLAQHYRVYTPDLPGFGGSDPLPLPFSISDAADRLLDWLRQEKIEDSVVVGHSLGGYIALAMVEKKSALFSGLGLFHSTAYADSDEKKDSRTKTIDFVKNHGAPAFTANFLEPLFANPNPLTISDLKKVTTAASAESVIGYTAAMRDRTDREHVIKSFTQPILFIGGKEDKAIPVSSLERLASVSNNPTFIVFENVAHMGMMEKPTETIDVLNGFMSTCK